MAQQPQASPTRRSRVRTLIIGLPAAVLMIVIGALWTAQAGGLIGASHPSVIVDALGPIVAGFGVALAWVCLRPPSS